MFNRFTLADVIWSDWIALQSEWCVTLTGAEHVELFGTLQFLCYENLVESVKRLKKIKQALIQVCCAIITVCSIWIYCHCKRGNCYL